MISKSVRGAGLRAIAARRSGSSPNKSRGASSFDPRAARETVESRGDAAAEANSLKTQEEVYRSRRERRGEEEVRPP